MVKRSTEALKKQISKKGTYGLQFCIVLFTALIFFSLVLQLFTDERYKYLFVVGHIMLIALSIIIARLLYVRFKCTDDEIFLFEEKDSEVDSIKDLKVGDRYGILTGSFKRSRKEFSFIVNITRNRISHVSGNSLFPISEGMEWDTVRNMILDASLDPRTRREMGKLLNPDAMISLYNQGVKRAPQVVGGFVFDEGYKYWLDMGCLVKMHPATGEMLALITAEDITEDRILISVLKRALEQNYDFVMCIETKNYGTLVFDASDQIRGRFNPSYEEEVEKNILAHAYGHDKKRAEMLTRLPYMKDILAEQYRYDFLINEKGKGGEDLKKFYKCSFLDNGRNYIYIVKQDVTEAFKNESRAKARLDKALKEREAAVNARSEFMTRMSHEMRTPMNAILGLSGLMLDEVNNPDVMRDYISKVNYSGHFLLQLINDVLDISRIEQDKFALNQVEYSFGEFWEAIDTMIGPMCMQKGLDFEIRSSIPNDYCILTDPLRITQIFINLLSNAVKYTKKGGHIVFAYRERERVGNIAKLSFSVKDDGIGMSEEFQKHMFEPFMQESTEVDSHLSGTGLGLPIVKGIVEKMGGKISVKSEQGKGTTFRVSLNVEVCGLKEKENNNLSEKDLSGLRVLLAEDNDINREIGVAILEKKGMIPETAVNGEKALEAFTMHEPGYYDIILMDIRMPVMSGLTATKRIRAMEREDAKTIPIIALTANAFSKDVQASLDAGLNEHLSKPIEPKLLYETIAKYV